MTHYVIFKFKKEAYTKEFYLETERAFTDMVKHITGVNSFKLIENIIDREANGQLMLMVELETKEMLQVYLDHPLHVAYANWIKLILIQKISLDY
jgi:hypothetical protein